MFDVLSGYSHAVLPHPDAATACAWAHETSYDNQLASGCRDGAVRVWLPSSRQCVHTLRSHAGPVLCVAWSPAGLRAYNGGPPQLLLASGGADKVIRVYDGVNGCTEREMKGHAGPVLSLAFSQVLSPFASSSTPAAAAAAASRKQPPKQPQQQQQEQATLLLVSGSGDKTARVHDPRSGSCLAVLKGHTDAVSSVALSVADGGQVFVTGGLDGSIRVFSTKTRACIATLDCGGGGGGSGGGAVEAKGQLQAGRQRARRQRRLAVEVGWRRAGGGAGVHCGWAGACGGV